jgi:predicted GIY-YIG superfamily endonuclease
MVLYKIYCITCNITGEVYFGSTEDMEARMRNHKNHRNCSSKQIIDRGDYKVEVLEEHDYTLTETREREDFYYQNFECVNKIRPAVPGRTKKESGKEYREANREILKKKTKEYREANKEKLKEKMTCECGSVSTKTNKGNERI